MSVQTYNLEWKTTLKQTPGEKYIRSKRYVINMENEHESYWRIELDPNFTDAHGTRYLSAYLVLEKTRKPEAVITAIFHIKLNTGGGNPCYYKCEFFSIT